METVNTLFILDKHTCYFYNPREILDIEMIISGIILIGGIIAILVQHFRFPKRKKVVGIVLMVINLCVLGLLFHATYNHGLYTQAIQ